MRSKALQHLLFGVVLAWPAEYVRADDLSAVSANLSTARRYVLPGGSAGIRLKAVDGTIILERR